MSTFIELNEMFSLVIYKQACLLSRILWYQQFTCLKNMMMNETPPSSPNDGCLTRWNEVVSRDSCLSQPATECS